MIRPNRSYKFSPVHPSIHISITPFSQGATDYFFLIFCISKYLKVMEPLFWGIFSCPKWVNWAFLGPNLVSLNFSPNVLIRFFRNLPDDRYLKVFKRRSFRIFRKNSSLKYYFWTFHEIFSLYFYVIIPDCDLKISKTDLSIFEKNSY